jgi:hypothetical protein
MEEIIVPIGKIFKYVDVLMAGLAMTPLSQVE